MSISFTGTVAYTPPGLPVGEWQAANSIYSEESVSGTITYDTTLFGTGSAYNSSTTEYAAAFASAGLFDMQVGALTFTANDPTIFVNRNNGELVLYFSQVAPFAAGTCASVGATNCNVDFILNTTSLRASDLPTNIPAMSGIDNVNFAGVFFNQSDTEGLEYFITSVNGASTPEPSSLALVVSVVLLLGILTRKTWLLGILIVRRRMLG